jgi:hypothetical protein
MAQLQKGTTYSTGDQVTAANINALVDSATVLPGAITEQISASSLTTSDSTLLAQSGGIRKATLGQLQSVFTPAEGIYLKSNGSVPLTTGQQLTLGTTAQIAPLNAVSLGHLQNNYLNKNGSVSMTSGQLNLSTTVQTSPLNAVSLGYLQSNYKSSPIVAWVYFNGIRNTSGNIDFTNTNRQIKASYNISSVERTAAGCYTINFATSLIDENYLITGNASFGTESAGAVTSMVVTPNRNSTSANVAPTTSQCVVYIQNTGGGGLIDSQYIYIAIIR